MRTSSDEDFFFGSGLCHGKVPTWVSTLYRITDLVKKLVFSEICIAIIFNSDITATYAVRTAELAMLADGATIGFSRIPPQGHRTN